VDAEEGYGSAIHVMDTVERFEETGADAIHIDDEKIPSKCPFLPRAPQNALIPVEEMKGKIRAAIEARDDPDFLIIARSDVVGTVPIDEFKRNRRKYYQEAVTRLNEYAKAGADLIFVYGLFSKEDADFFKKAINAPLLGLYSGGSPIPFEAYRKLHYQVVISPVAMLLSAAKGMVKGLQALKESKGDWLKAASRDVFMNDRDFYDIVKLKSYKDAYRKFHVS
jgi:2-methylisocitrate lyase-like PEP mutase family enzyme